MTLDLNNAYSVNLNATYVVSIDMENNAEEFWQEVEQWLSEFHAERQPLDGVARVIEDILLSSRPVTVPGTFLHATLQWLQQFPGWADGPAHARHPIVVNLK